MNADTKQSPGRSAPPLERWVYWAEPRFADRNILVSAGDRPNPCNAVNLEPRFDLRNHSPSGFNWGFGGSGPAQAALAIVAHCTGDDELALRVYQRFKEAVIAKLGERWDITSRQVLMVVAAIEREMEGGHCG
jgi:hypothetical protein